MTKITISDRGATYTAKDGRLISVDADDSISALIELVKELYAWDLAGENRSKSEKTSDMTGEVTIYNRGDCFVAIFRVSEDELEISETGDEKVDALRYLIGAVAEL